MDTIWEDNLGKFVGLMPFNLSFAVAILKEHQHKD